MSTVSTGASLYNVEVEASVLAALLQYGSEIWGDFYLIEESDWSKHNRPLFSIIKGQLDQTPPASVAPVVIAEKLRGYNITIEGVDAYEYCLALTIRHAEKGHAPALARELKRISVRRQLVEKAHAVQKELVAAPNATFEEMTKLVERGLTSIDTTYHRPTEFTNVFETIIEVTEKRADNPVDVTKMGYMGPFPVMNQICGALADKGLFITIGARTGNQKSALGFHYNLFLAEKYDMPILLLDVGEMSLERIQRRAVCCMAEGKVPLWAVASGEWRQNKEWKHIIQHECWPRVKKLRFDYINVGNLTPHEKVTLIRRYYHQRVGRGNTFGILDDYLKGVEALGKNHSEYQSVGYYVQDIKDLITGEIPAWFWTSVQNNRSGSYQGKKAGEITDSEDQMGLSDRIIQQSDWGFILRFKVTEEIASENQLFGNMRLTPVKTRELLGKDYKKSLRPVQLPSGKWVPNFFSLETESFHFTEKGDLNQMLKTLGRAPVDMTDKEKPTQAL